MELQVSRAGQTRLTTPALSDDPSQLPEFIVGLGAHPTDQQHKEQKGRDKENQSLDTRERGASADSKETQPEPPKTHMESATTHKAALLAKYIKPWSEGGRPTVQESQTASSGIGPTAHRSLSGGRGCDGVPLGPRQQQVIAELIERGEKLREAMTRAVLDSGVGRRGRRERREGEVLGKKFVPLCGIGGVYSSEEEEERGDTSMEESGYLLKHCFLQEKLLQSVSLLQLDPNAQYVCMSISAASFVMTNGQWCSHPFPNGLTQMANRNRLNSYHLCMFYTMWLVYR